MVIYRQEKFGGVIFDTNKLRFDFAKSSQPYDKFIPLKKSYCRTDILSAPIRVYFEITRRCNLHCKHCFVSATPRNYYGLPQGIIFDLLDDLSNANVIDIRFTGGEPTYREDWYDLMAYAKQKGFVISINTNGVYENPKETITLFQKLNFDQITISLDGLESNHDFIRGSGNYKKTVNAIKEMSRRGLKLRINTVLNNKNIKDIPKLLDFASNYVKEINFFYMRSIGRAKDIEKMSLTFWEHFNSAKFALEKQKDYPNLNIMHFERSFIERSISTKTHESYGLSKTYPYGSTTLNIAADGSFWPHGYSTYQMASLELGKFPEKSIVEIWHHSRKLDKLRSWFAELGDICSDCEHYMFTCAGINFESEVARMLGRNSLDRLCIKNIEFPKLCLKDL